MIDDKNLQIMKIQNQASKKHMESIQREMRNTKIEEEDFEDELEE